MIVVGSLLLGAAMGGIVGLGIGAALGPGPEAGGEYGLLQAASAFVGGAWGLFVGAIVGGFSGWATWVRRGRDRT